MDTILQGIPCTICYIDDILVTGTSEAEHLDTLDEVLKRLEQHGIKANLNKCKFFADSVKRGNMQ